MYNDTQIIAVKKNLLVCFKISYDEYLNYKNLPQGKQIIQGHLNEWFNLGEEISAKRIQICKKCPLYR